MCKHSSFLTEETCTMCQEQKQFEPAHFEPIYEGMTELDNQAARLGSKIKGFKFCDSRRKGARGRRRGKVGAE